MNLEPKSLQEAIVYFSNPDNCIDYLAVRRWPDGTVVCPTCGSTSVSNFNITRRTWKCSSHHAKREFSIKVGTVMEESPIGLDKWLTATWMVLNCKNGVSSCEIARTVRITQKSAWFMLHRIRLALHDDSTGKLGGEVEVDETFIGGKARNMHLDKRERRITGTGGKDKTIVFGALQRGGKVKATVVADRKKQGLQAQVKAHVEAGSALYSDALNSYDGLASDFAHKVVDHAEEYVNGKVHTNGLENFWSLLKRGLNGTYVSVEPFHLFRYLDEQMFRYNNRGGKKLADRISDADRFTAALLNFPGKRLTFAELTGKVCETSAF
jgi:transposase-like protein